MTTKTRKVTKAQGAFVLKVTAAWLGKNGCGEFICKDGRALDWVVRHEDDKTPCDNWGVGPAPTGPDAAYRGIGPDLVEEFYGNAAIVLEGGPEEWAIRASFAIQKQIDAKGLPLFVEPVYSFVLGIYRTD